jgi:murein DD-endopeptidase MepM/ murein hydrolase activator NlpD
MEIAIEKHTTNAFEDLYDDWNNVRCHAKTATVPKAYKINLKNFSMPIKRDLITSKFGKRWGRNHNGVDIKAYHGDTIYSAFGGKVRVVKNDPNGYGNVIVIRHWNGLETVYGHLSKQIVKPNEIIKAGHPIGLAGNTGRSSGTHLHFETRFCGIPINPLEIFSFKDEDVVGDFYHWRK